MAVAEQIMSGAGIESRRVRAESLEDKEKIAQTLLEDLRRGAGRQFGRVLTVLSLWRLGPVLEGTVFVQETKATEGAGEQGAGRKAEGALEPPLGTIIYQSETAPQAGPVRKIIEQVPAGKREEVKKVVDNLKPKKIEINEEAIDISFENVAIGMPGNMPEIVKEQIWPGDTLSAGSFIRHEWAVHKYERGAKIAAGEQTEMAGQVDNVVEEALRPYNQLGIGDINGAAESVTVVCDGTASPEGTVKGNDKVSQARADDIVQAAVESLVKRGISRDKIKVETSHSGGVGDVMDFVKSLEKAGVKFKAKDDAGKRAEAKREYIDLINEGKFDEAAGKLPEGVRDKPEILRAIFDRDIASRRGGHLEIKIDTKPINVVTEREKTKQLPLAKEHQIKPLPIYKKVFFVVKEDYRPEEREEEPFETFIIIEPPEPKPEPKLKPEAGAPGKAGSREPVPPVSYPEALPVGKRTKLSAGGKPKIGAPVRQAPAPGKKGRRIEVGRPPETPPDIIPDIDERIRAKAALIAAQEYLQRAGRQNIFYKNRPRQTQRRYGWGQGSTRKRGFVKM